MYAVNAHVREHSLGSDRTTPDVKGIDHAWDTVAVSGSQIVSDHVVHTVSTQGADVRALLQNRVYQNVSSLIAGMQEYAAVEALHGFIVDDRYDLVVLDTPPSRHALDFLEAPRRLSRLIDTRAISAFLPKSDSAIARAASAVTLPCSPIVNHRERPCLFR